MAILKGVRASVHVAGQALFEYNPDADLPIDNVAQNETTRYIECRGGVQFEIRAGPAGLPDPRLPMFGLLSDVFVDGSLICTLFTSPGQPMRCKGSQYWKEGVRYLRRFEFADIRTSKLKHIYLHSSLVKVLEGSTTVPIVVREAFFKQL